MTKHTHIASDKPHTSSLLTFGLIALGATALLAISFSAHAQSTNEYSTGQQFAENMQKGKRRGPPPREALEVCEDKDVKQACKFTDKRRGKTISGKCATSPRGEKICIPADHKRPRS